ncbi:MAG TPA: hypothetical protein VN442_13325 [Bryobacteraceae bacterium]|nr:hypothetical protein [Bryobacteraceae bacterium]
MIRVTHMLRTNPNAGLAENQPFDQPDADVSQKVSDGIALPEPYVVGSVKRANRVIGLPHVCPQLGRNGRQIYIGARHRSATRVSHPDREFSVRFCDHSRPRVLHVVRTALSVMQHFSTVGYIDRPVVNQVVKDQIELTGLLDRLDRASPFAESVHLLRFKPRPLLHSRHACGQTWSPLLERGDHISAVNGWRSDRSAMRGIRVFRMRRMLWVRGMTRMIPVVPIILAVISGIAAGIRVGMVLRHRFLAVRTKCDRTVSSKHTAPSLCGCGMIDVGADRHSGADTAGTELSGPASAC